MPTTARFGFWLALFVTFLTIAGCDTSEDPNLLNPPLPDSTLVRVVNLTDDAGVSVGYGSTPVATGVGPLRSSEYRRFLFVGPTDLVVERPNRRDTIRNVTLPAKVRVTYFLVGTPDTTYVVTAQAGQVEEDDLKTRGLARVVLLNAVDSARYAIRSGCQSGDEVLPATPFATTGSAQIPAALTSTELSLYLINDLDSTSVTSARIPVTAGTITYLVAERENGAVKLFVVGTSPNELAGTLQEAPPETRTEASVQVLNALGGTTPISAQLKGSPILVARDLPSLEISASTSVGACMNPTGDVLTVEPSGGTPLDIPIKLTVGSRTLVAVYSSETGARAVTLNRDLSPPESGKIYLRGVNLTSKGQEASIMVGAGAPAGVAANTRLFGTLKPGDRSDYVKLGEGLYPLLLTEGGTGRYLMGGLQSFSSGYYTLFIMDGADGPTIRLVRDDDASTTLSSLTTPGTIAILFNMIPDADATFELDNVRVEKVAYSYVVATAVPRNVTRISMNGVQVSIDNTAAINVIGATGSAAAPKLITFAGDPTPPTAGRAAIRFLNAVPGVDNFDLRIDTIQSDVVMRLPYGAPSNSLEREGRKFSFVLTTDPPDTTRVNGIQVVAGRRYILVVGPKRNPTSATNKFETLWLQE